MRPEHVDAPDAPTRELRLALGMRGGVSLAVWIGGACAEIDELRRDEASFWSPLASACGYDHVTVDVLAGASAGGLNGALFASAIRHGFRMKDLLPIWREVASVQLLRRTGAPWISLFDGDRAFLDRINTEMRRLIPASGGPPPDSTIDLQLTATLVEPLKIKAPSPSDEDLWRQRSGATFHFRHDAGGADPRHDLEADDRAVARLAVAARATSSFPGAFEAAIVRSTRPNEFGLDDASADAGRLVDCRGVFSESRGPAMAPQSSVRAPRPESPEEPREDDFVVADGGIVDNIPLGRALDAVAAAPASGPTRRVLVYLHPTGPSPPTGPVASAATSTRAVARRGIQSVITGTIAASMKGESIDGDLDQLERHNRSIRVAHMLRRATLEELATDSEITINAAQWSTYVIQRAAADAARLRRLLDDPLLVLGEDPFPSGDDALWRAPLDGWSAGTRESLDEELTLAFRRALKDLGGPGDALLTVGLAALRRSIGHALEWVRALPVDAEAGVTKQHLYHLRSVVGVLERVRRLGWVTMAALRRPEESTAESWCIDAIDEVDRLAFAPPAASSALLDPEGSAGDYLACAYERLNQRLRAGADSNRPGEDDAWCDVRTAVTSKIGELLEPLLHNAGALDAGHPAALADQVLNRVAGGVTERLAALEILSLAEHLSGTQTGQLIDFYRISAANESPLAPQFTELHAASKRIDAKRPDGWQTNDRFLRPEVKLAGNELSNFSAFFDSRWRENDWLWGRLDAASGLVDVLLASASASVSAGDGGVEGGVPDAARALAGQPPGASRDAVRLALIAQRQNAILNEAGLSVLDRATYRTGLDTLTRPGSADIRAAVGDLAAVATHVLRETLPAIGVVARPLGWLGRAAAWWLARPRGLKGGRAG